MMTRLGWAAARVAAAAWAGRAEQRPGPRQEHLARLGEPGALRGAVEQPGAELLLEAADLTAQRRLRDQQDGGGAAEVPLLGDNGESSECAPD